MYYNSTVEIPTTKGIIIKKKGKATYILYQYGNRYNAEKKYAVPLRAIIGKMDTFNEKLMFPNEKFQIYFPDVMLTERLPEINKSCCLRIGLYAVIRCVIQENNLAKLLSECFQQDFEFILDLISYLIADDNKGGLNFSDYAFTHPLFSESMNVYNDQVIYEYINSITNEQAINFLGKWNHARDHKKGICIPLVFSNSSYMSGDIGHMYVQAENEQQNPVCINAIAFDETDCTPLFCVEYPGSMTDVYQFSIIADEMMKYGYHKVAFILDHRYFRKENIGSMQNLGG